MGDQRALDAIGRIERALARIEAASSSPNPFQTTSEDLAQLRDTHQALRSRVEGAIGQLDQLLESGGGS
jgi:hypothetical protein